MSIIKGGNVTVMVSNMDDAIRFYTEVLGLALKNRYGDHWADIEAPGLSIGLHPTNNEMVRGHNLQIGLIVDDLDSAVEELAGKGVVFKINEEDMVRLAGFSDPDGNELYLVQPK